jgi:hypothetical protein
MTLSLKNLTFFFHDEVRQSASMFVSLLLVCPSSHSPSFIPLSISKLS